MYSVINAIKEAFPQTETNNCLQTLTDTKFHIYDHETKKRCYVQNDPNGVKHFTVENADGRSIHFLAVDKCLLTDAELTQRCDCAVFDEQTFCFVEIKTTSSDNDRRKAKCRKKAFDQLKSTIVYFKEKINFDTTKIEAYITLITGNILDEDEVIELQPKPRVRANLIEKAAEFDEIGVALFFDKIKCFAEETN